ncbi:MAG: S46 family peptidase [Marinifilaceae bacterium]
MKCLLNLILILLISIPSFADEGMWIPMLLKKYNIETMNQKGFKLTADDIYSINQASLKDAVVGLGRKGRPFAHFCTGELVSEQGLMLTNHHCAFDMIQTHSSLEKNYLRDGFWAMNQKEELANPEVTASILVRMEDVTPQLATILNEKMTDEERAAKLKSAIAAIEKKAVEGTNYSANVKPYFNGNQYILAVYKIYNDVRLVGAPPSAIGKFGGDTDNWMWPRHTGDFAVLRIYANKDNEPAAYNADNVPYSPEKFFKIATGNLNEGDFTMVFGYPGTTNQYATSYEVDQTVNVDYPSRIAVRTAKLDVINKAMNADDLTRIKYAAKAAGIANGWKKWQGEVQGVTRFATIANKQTMEQQFRSWSNNMPQYADLLNQYEKLYKQREAYVTPMVYLTEAGTRGAEAVTFAGEVMKQATNKNYSKEHLLAQSEGFFKDFSSVVDQNILVQLLTLYKTNVSETWQPQSIRKLRQHEVAAYAKKMYDKSIFTDAAVFKNAVGKTTNATELQQLIKKDGVYRLYNEFSTLYTEQITPSLNEISGELKKLQKDWMAGLMAMNADKNFFPDANSTLRVSYGKVQGYKPKDGVKYTHYTTLTGIMEKDIPTIYDYNVPQKLRDLYKARDFGDYTQEGEVPVCFVASNHTTGGNSGSPVLNANGELIGINFDRAWDGVMSDLDFQPEICRNIAVDIRYVLFIVDKLAGAKHLINEMELVN